MRMRIELDLPLAGNPCDMPPNQFEASVTFVQAKYHKKEDSEEMARHFYKFVKDAMPAEFYDMLRDCFAADQR